MKSLPPLPPGMLLGSESEVLPKPLGPIAADVEPLVVDVDGERVVTGEPVEELVLPRRLVAAVNAEDAFGADVETDEVELELDEDAAEVEVVAVVAERSRP